VDAWVIWIIAAAALGAGEIATTGFFLAPFAGGAVLAAIVAAAGAGGVIPAVIFLAASAAFFALLRPVALRHTRMPPQIRTGTDALIGEQAVVLQRIANGEGVGSVKLGGEVWTARAYDEEEVLEVGEKVLVMEIKGATALVTEV
jgi:membrane protein implicated in regulation of membrane protease activity